MSRARTIASAATDLTVNKTLTGDGTALTIKGSYAGNPSLFEVKQVASDGYAYIRDALGNTSQITGYPSGSSIIRGRVTMPDQYHLSGWLTNTANSRIANTVYNTVSKGGLSFATDRVTVPVAGVYLITFTTISTNTASRVDANILINGGEFVNMLSEDSTTGYHYKSASVARSLAANDYIQFANANWYDSTGSGGGWKTFSVTMIG